MKSTKLSKNERLRLILVKPWWKRTGMEGRRLKRALRPFFANIEVDQGCHLWKGAVHDSGYGAVKFTGRFYYSHVLMWMAMMGPIPRLAGEMAELDHLCRDRLCCFLDHIEPVTAQVNSLRSNSPGSIAWRKKHGLEPDEVTMEVCLRLGSEQ